jgi:tetratricopeptide (TPR) repeat protein
MEKLDRGLDYMKKAVQLKEELGDPSALAVGYVNLAGALHGVKRFDEALVYFNKSLSIEQTLKEEKILLTIYQGLGNLYVETNEFDKASPYMDKVFDIANKNGDKGLLMNAYVSYGVLYFKQKNYQQCEENWNKALAIAVELKDAYFTDFIKERLSLCYEKQGDYKNALIYYKQYTEETQKNHDIEIQDKINALEKKYESEKKEKQIIELKQKETTLSNLSEKRKYYIIISVISCLLLFMLLAFIVFRNKNRKKQQVLELEKNRAVFEQQALRAQMNPHFIFNALNSIQHYILDNETQYAYDYLARFSKLIRQVLSNSQKNEITLQDEIELLKIYIDLEHRRFKDRFDYQINYPDDLPIDEIKIPVMLIQPFVENAIWHGIMNLDKSVKGFVSVNFELTGKQLKIIIEDNGVGREASALFKVNNEYQSIGTLFTQKRLELLKGINKEEAAIEVVDMKDEKGRATGTRVEILITVG